MNHVRVLIAAASVALASQQGSADGVAGNFDGHGLEELLPRQADSDAWLSCEMDSLRPIPRRHADVLRDDVNALGATDDFDGDGHEILLLHKHTTGERVALEVAGAAPPVGSVSVMRGDLASRTVAAEPSNSEDGLWTTEDGIIVVEMGEDETTSENLLDLDESTLVFTPDGAGGYVREVHALAWENELGDPVGDSAEIALPFSFEFGGDTWDAARVNQRGLLVFGNTYADPYWDHGDRFGALETYAHRSLLSANVVAPLYKPLLTGSVHVATGVDRVVVTWSVTEWSFHVHGVAPEVSAGYQAVLHEDGRIAFHYRNLPFGDGIVGLFPRETIGGKGETILSVSDRDDDNLPGHLDLTEATIHESTDGRGVIVEFATREPVPEPSDDESYHYSLFFDFDEPYWGPEGFWEDLDFQQTIDVRAAGHRSARGGVILPRQNGNRIAMLGILPNVGATFGSVVANVVGFESDGNSVDWLQPALVSLPSPRPPSNLSTPASGNPVEHSEVFHYRRPANNLVNSGVAARIIDGLGDEFDFFVFYSQFRVDVQENGSPMSRFGENVGVQGIGDIGLWAPQYDSSRVKGGYYFPVWIGSRNAIDLTRPEGQRLDEGFMHISHEFMHVWTALASYDRNGSREPLNGTDGSHWRWEIHLPAAFPWRAEDATARTSMGGVFWHERGDGTFEMVWNQSNSLAGGPSWLDLYLMGLAGANELPDLLILRNAERSSDQWNKYTATKEFVTVDQIVSAEGPRLPPAGDAQSVFNLAFVYLLEPGGEADPDLLAVYRNLRDGFVTYWAHVTGGRSEITTGARSVSSPGPN